MLLPRGARLNLRYLRKRSSEKRKDEVPGELSGSPNRKQFGYFRIREALVSLFYLGVLTPFSNISMASSNLFNRVSCFLA